MIASVMHSIEEGNIIHVIYGFPSVKCEYDFMFHIHLDF